METERQNIFKGQTEEEIKKAFNNKWLEIIKNCTYKKTSETQKSSLQRSDKSDIMSLAENQTCSANPSKRS